MTRGFSLVEIIVGLTVAGFLMFAVSQFFVSSRSDSRAASAQGDWLALNELVVQTLERDVSCSAALNGKSIPSTLAELKHQGTVVVKFDSVTENKLRILEIRLDPSGIAPLPVAIGGVAYQHTFAKLLIRARDQGSPPVDYDRSFFVAVLLNAGGAIDKCLASPPEPNFSADGCGVLGGTYVVGPPERCDLPVAQIPALALGGTYAVGDGRGPGVTVTGPPPGGLTPESPLSDQNCETPHALTGDCTCPAGFHAVPMDETCEGRCAWRWTIRVACVRD